MSVVLVQALIHYVVFGVRRERIQQEEEAVLEESLSLSTNDSFVEAELEPHTSESTSSDPSSPARSASPVFAIQHNVHVLKTASSPNSSIAPHMISPRCSMLGDAMVFEPSPLYLTQTGTEMLKVCSSPFDVLSLLRGDHLSLLACPLLHLTSLVLFLLELFVREYDRRTDTSRPPIDDFWRTVSIFRSLARNPFENVQTHRWTTIPTQYLLLSLQPRTCCD